MEFGGLAGVGDAHGRDCMSTTPPPPNEEDMDLRRGPWTAEEDLILTNYITARGEGRWNSLAHCAGIYLYINIHMMPMLLPHSTLSCAQFDMS